MVPSVGCFTSDVPVPCLVLLADAQRRTFISSAFYYSLLYYSVAKASRLPSLLRLLGFLRSRFVDSPRSSEQKPG